MDIFIFDIEAAFTYRILRIFQFVSHREIIEKFFEAGWCIFSSRNNETKRLRLKLWTVDWREEGNTTYYLCFTHPSGQTTWQSGRIAKIRLWYYNYRSGTKWFNVQDVKVWKVTFHTLKDILMETNDRTVWGVVVTSANQITT